MLKTSTPQQLLLIKQLYDDAVVSSDKDDDLSLTKTLIMLDLAIEQMLNQIIRDCSLSTGSSAAFGRKDVGWQNIWNAADKAAKENGFDLIHHRDLSSLHEARNMAQHNATIPTQIEAARYLRPASEMISDVFRNLYQFDFYNFNLLDLIENPHLRQILQDSQYALENDSAYICVAGCNLAYKQVMSALRRHLAKERMRPSSSSSVSNRHKFGSEFNRVINEIRAEMLTQIRFLEDEVLAIGIGFPIIETQKFRRSGSWVGVFDAVDGTIQISLQQPSASRLNSESEARFMLSYLSRLIRLVEEAYPGVLNHIEFAKSFREQDFWSKVETK